MAITIGSDPEFGIVNENGDQVLARDYVPNDTQAPIGVDGHSDIGELRPQYGNSPREHAENISKLIMDLDRFIPLELKVTAGSMVGLDPIGGHIHFGDLGRNFDRKLALRALDYYLALPVALIEVGASAVTRRRSNYGQLGAYRETDWGFEYRTPPSWLVGWGTALSILSIGYAVVDAVKRKDCPRVPKGVPDPLDFKGCNKNAMRGLLGDIRRGWRNLSLYSELRLEIAFLNHLLTQKMEWRENIDIRERWPGIVARREWPAGFKIIANPNDEGCIKIVRLVDEAKKDLKVYIYGLSPNREYDMALSHQAAGAPDAIIALERFGRAASADYNDWLCIGLSLTLRQNVEECAEIINRILAGRLTPLRRTRPGRAEATRTTEDRRWLDRHGYWRQRDGTFTRPPEHRPF